jgi:hypothetical protein
LTGDDTSGGGAVPKDSKRDEDSMFSSSDNTKISKRQFQLCGSIQLAKVTLDIMVYDITKVLSCHDTLDFTGDSNWENQAHYSERCGTTVQLGELDPGIISWTMPMGVTSATAMDGMAVVGESMVTVSGSQSASAFLNTIVNLYHTYTFTAAQEVS